MTLVSFPVICMKSSFQYLFLVLPGRNRGMNYYRLMAYVFYISIYVCVCVLDDLFEIVHFQCCLSCTAPLRTKQTRMTQWGKRKERKDPVVNKVLYVALLKLQPRFKCLMVHIVIRWHTKM